MSDTLEIHTIVFMNKNVLVIGGCGYIGSIVSKLISEKDYQVSLLDDFSTGSRQVASQLAFPLYEGDYGDEQVLADIFSQRKYDAVLLFAASTSVTESLQNPEQYYHNNFFKVYPLLKMMKKFSVNQIIFSSTAAVYGDVEHLPVSELSPLRPKSAYGRSKMMSELLIEDLASQWGMKWVILRYFNVAGASVDQQLGQRNTQANHLMKVCAQAALQQRPKVEVFGTDYQTSDGSGVRDFIHVHDLAQAHILSLDYLNKGGGSDTFNVGYGQGVTVLETIKAFQKVSGVDFQVEYGDRRAGDIGCIYADCQKIKKIGWSAQYNDLEFMAKSTYLWEKKVCKTPQ